MPPKIQEDENFLVALDPTKLNAESQAFKTFLEKPRIIGQERLQDTAIRAMGHFKRTFKKENQLTDSFLTLGTSGTAKTFICELMAEYKFGSRNSMTKISGPEYREEHAIATLIGSPPGYIGFGANPKSPFPVLSPWNLFKYDYFRRVKEVTENTKKQTDQLTRSEIEKVMEELDKLQKREYYLSGRIETLACYIDVVQTSPKPAYQTRKSNAQLTIGQQNSHAKTDYEKEKIKATVFRILERGADYARSRLAYDIDELSDLHNRIDQLTDVLSKYAMSELEFDPEIDNQAIILVDEIDKGHPSSFVNIWYEVTDKARIALKNGEIVNLSNTIVSMTANWGDEEQRKILTGKGVVGFTQKNQQRKKTTDRELYLAARNAAAKNFPSQLFGRIKEVVVTRPYSPDQIRRIITEIEIRDLRELLQTMKLDITLSVSDEVIDFLLKESLDKPEEGARLPRKKVEHYLENPLDDFFQTGQIRPGDKILVLLGEENGEPKPVFKVDTTNRKVAK